jgi:hypothetical protein
VPGWASTLLGVAVGALLAYVFSRVAYGRARRDAARDAEIRDLDETIRLLLVLQDQLRHTNPGNTINAELAATIANALGAHSRLLTGDGVFDFLARLHDVKTKADRDAVVTEVRGYIAKLGERRASLG